MSARAPDRSASVDRAESRANGQPARVRRLEPAAIAGVMSRDVTMFGRYWVSTTFSAIVEPTIYLLAFGFGLGGLIASVAGIDYIEFIGTGIVAMAVLFSSVFPGMFQTFIRRHFQRTYDAILAAPVDVEELVTAEASWICLRASVYSMAPLLVSIGFGLRPEPSVAVVPLVALLTGFGFACFGITIAGFANSIDNFNYIISAVITPLFLVAGTFFPIDELPHWASVAAQANPLFHCVELVRHAVFGLLGTADLVHVGALALFALVTWRLAIWRLRLRLID